MLETICVRIEYEVGVQGIDNVLGTRNGDGGLCPFLTVPGWKGPKHEQEFRTTATRGRGYGRGRSFRRGPRF